MSATREDKDAIGTIELASDALWSAQTQRSVVNFPFGFEERQPRQILEALAYVKEAAARTHLKKNNLDSSIANAIIESAQVIRAALRGEKRGVTSIHSGITYEMVAKSFPLVIWQTGSGTQSNMNMNEVISNLASVRVLQPENFQSVLGKKEPVHPNDHVNKGQSSNDVFPSAVCIAVTLASHSDLLPSLNHLVSVLERKVEKFSEIVKMGRTHLMDAVPMTLGQEFSAYVAALKMCRDHITRTLPVVNQLALGGTAVGTGLNSYKGFDNEIAEVLSEITGVNFVAAPNKFQVLSTITHLVAMGHTLSTLSSSLLKMANDIRLLGSGPRAGLCELELPANEPGSSIMPGKVNPTQCESLAMVCACCMGNMSSLQQANTYGHLQLNVFYPLASHTLLRTISLLSVGMRTFADRCIEGIVPRTDIIGKHVSNSLMLVTALNAHIGYDACSRIAKHAHKNNLSLKESALELGLLTEAEFAEYIQPAKMANPF